MIPESGVIPYYVILGVLALAGMLAAAVWLAVSLTRRDDGPPPSGE